MQCLIHLLKTRGLGDKEEARPRLLGAFYTVKKTERNRRLSSSISSLRQPAAWEFLGLVNIDRVAKNSD